MSDAGSELLDARFDEIHLLEAEFDNVEVDLIRKANTLHTPLYKKRADFIAKVPHFWPLVFEQAPPEIDNYILPSDSQLFAECFDTFEVSRFEIDDPNGSPRSFSLKFGFKENEYFEDKVLEKKFWFRRTSDWQGLVSEPVSIKWKKGKDLTDGLTDAAYALGQARKNASGSSADAEARKKETTLPEYTQLVEKIEKATEEMPSFFALFAFVSGYRWVDVAESQAAEKEDKARIEKLKRGEEVEDEEEEDDSIAYHEAEVFPSGDELATILAEDMWPNALKYYQNSFDEDDDDDDDMDGTMDLDEDDSDVDESAEEVDIRALVGKGKSNKSEAAPPSKKQRKQ